MDWLFGGFSKQTLASNLIAMKHRMRLHHEKTRNEIERNKREIAQLLNTKQYDKARIRIESVVINERQIEAEEILDLMAELMKARVEVLAKEPKCPPDALESVHTLIWAASRTDIQELKIVRQQLIYRYGEKWCEPALKGEGEHCYLNPDVKERLLLTAPPRDKCIEALVAIATKNNIPFDPVKDLANSRIGLGTVTNNTSGNSSGTTVPPATTTTTPTSTNPNHSTTVPSTTDTNNTTTTIVVTSNNDGNDPIIQIQNPPLSSPSLPYGGNGMTYLDPYTGQPMNPNTTNNNIPMMMVPPSSSSYPNPSMMIPPNYPGNNNNNVPPFPSTVPMALPMVPPGIGSNGMNPMMMMMPTPPGYPSMTTPGYTYGNNNNNSMGGNNNGNPGNGMMYPPNFHPVQPTVPSSSSTLPFNPDDPNFGVVTKPQPNEKGNSDEYPDGVPPPSSSSSSSSTTTTGTTTTASPVDDTAVIDTLQARLQALRASRQ